jgi:hypothetical protein
VGNLGKVVGALRAEVLDSGLDMVLRVGTQDLVTQAAVESF